MANHAQDEPTVVRFSLSARAFHWALAFPTLVLLATGLPLLFPALRGWLRGYDAGIGLRLHMALSVFLLAPALVLLLGNRRALRADAGELFRLSREDWRWLPWLPGYLVGSPGPLDQVGRFNAGQKLNAWALFASLAGLTLSGLLLWLKTPPTLLPLLRWLHDALTALVGALVAGHIFLATLHPHTRAALRGMLDGRVPAAWAARHYPRWVGRPAPPDPHGRAARSARITHRG